MNKKILTLSSSHFPRDTDGNISVTKEGLAEFAESIVQECVGIVEGLPSGYKDYRDQIEDAFRRDCVFKMKEHFGVK